MQSTLDIVTAEPKPRLTTLARVKADLGITANDTNDLLLQKIDEASADITLALGFTVASESVIETFRNEVSNHTAFSGALYGGRRIDADKLFLRRKAPSVVTTVTLDDDVMDSAEYYLDKDKGTLNRLDASGYPCDWCFSKSLIVAYMAGYVLPGVSGSNLPPGIEGMTVDLIKEFWFSRKRDPLIKSEDLPGVRQVEYWVGAVGDPSQLPPAIQRKVALYRRPRIAVA